MQLKTIASLGIAATLAFGAFAVAQDSKPAAPAATEKGEKKADKKSDAGKSAAAKVGSPAPAFTLKDASGKDVSLSDFKGKVVVLEWINPGCPVCKGKMDDGSVAKMMKDSKDANPDVAFLFVNSTASMADEPEDSAEYLKDHKIEAPALIDGDGTVGRAYGAKTTPHCYVIDASGTLVYEGAIDDQKDTNYVVKTVKSLKAGEAVSPATTKPYGCSVKYKKG
jgi:peroxiredoxin